MGEGRWYSGGEEERNVKDRVLLNEHSQQTYVFTAQARPAAPPRKGQSGQWWRRHCKHGAMRAERLLALGVVWCALLAPADAAALKAAKGEHAIDDAPPAPPLGTHTEHNRFCPEPNLQIDEQTSHCVHACTDDRHCGPGEACCPRGCSLMCRKCVDGCELDYKGRPAMSFVFAGMLLCGWALACGTVGR